MAALGGADATDVALRFFANVRAAAPDAALDAAAAQAGLLDGMTPCTANVAHPPLLPPLNGLTAGPCSDVATVLPPDAPPTQGMASWR